MVGVNTIMTFVGMAIAGFAIYARVEWQALTQQQDSALARAQDLLIGVDVAIGLGCFIVLVSLLGCCGALRGSKGALSAYVGLMFLVTSSMISVAVAVFLYGSDFDNAETDTGRSISNIVLALQKSCCNRTVALCPDVATTVPPLYTCFYPTCDADGVNAASCASVVEGSTAPVIDAAGSIDGGAVSVCAAVESLAFSSEAGGTATACAGGTYGRILAARLKDLLNYTRIGLVVASSLLLLLYMIGIALCCRAKAGNADGFDGDRPGRYRGASA